MKYKYGTRRKAVEYEKALAEYWKKNRTFEKSVEGRSADNSYVFYDGPPFITGNPHHGTLLSSIVKDAVPRFWTMRGKRVERRWGWDCHGLPAENFTEKHLGGTVSRVAGGDANVLELKIGERVELISLQKYIETARGLMVANSETWEGTIDRIGRWVDFRGAYRTMDKDYMESVWWAFSELYRAGKIYEGEKVLMYDTTFGTPVSKNEVTMDNDAYREVTDPSVYVKFKIKNPLKIFSYPVFLLAWTTTPWTLPGNTALAVNSGLKYVEVRVGEESFVVAKALVEKVFAGREYEVIRDDIAGTDLVGLEYESIFEATGNKVAAGSDVSSVAYNDEKVKYKVWGADYVEAEAGTGIVHLAPVYGEEDFELAREKRIATLHVLDDNGYYYPEVVEKLRAFGVRDTDERGIEVWGANKFIAKCLNSHGADGRELSEEEVKLGKGVVWKIEYIKHEYPFNPRSGQRIMYRAIPSWFFDVQGSKRLLLEKNEGVNWFPEYLKEGRFRKNIEQAPDWNLSRDRFWATAMPVWKGDKGTMKVIGSYDELYELSGVRLEDYHRPYVDEVEFDVDGEHFRRVDKVLDCWFESGSMPFAQLHYPFENREKFEKNYPADFIVEYVGQVRAWFYYVHTVNCCLAEVGSFGEEIAGRADNFAYRNVITTGTLAGNDGRKMSKSLGNFTDPNELMDKYSADALRFLLLSSPVLSGEDFALLDKDVSDVARKLAMIWNMYDFFTMYAEVDGWDSEDSWKPEGRSLGELRNPLDRWILSRLHQLKGEIIRNMEGYNLPDALSGVLPFVDDASNWFVRRSRRRFWKSEDDADKAQAYWTLYTVLSKLAVMLAPFVPFLAEELWQKMVGGESVHLLDYPTNVEVDQKALDDMARTRRIVEMGLGERMKKSETEQQIKVRQPLATLSYTREKLDEFYESIIADEVNVKKVVHVTTNKEDIQESFADVAEVVRVDKTLTQELEDEGFARELIRFVQVARKKAGLNVDDRIKLSLSEEVPGGFSSLVGEEVLAEEMSVGKNYGYDEIVRIGERSVAISLQKA